MSACIYVYVRLQLCAFSACDAGRVWRVRINGDGCEEGAGGVGGCFVGSGRPRSVVCHTIQGFNAGVIKEQLQGCMDTRQSKPNEVSIGCIGAHAWTKASWHSFREGPLQGEQTHTHAYSQHTQIIIVHTSQKQADDNIRDSVALSFNHMGNNEDPRLVLLGLSVCVCPHLPITLGTTNRTREAIFHWKQYWLYKWWLWH